MGVGDDGVGPHDGPAHEESLSDHADPGEGPGHVEDGQIVDGGHRGTAQAGREIDIEPVDQSGRAHVPESFESPPDPVARTAGSDSHLRWQLPDGVLLDDGFDARDDMGREYAQELGDVGRHTGTTGAQSQRHHGDRRSRVTQ